jgi:hypothetical protein
MQSRQVDSDEFDFGANTGIGIVNSIAHRSQFTASRSALPQRLGKTPFPKRLEQVVPDSCSH